MPPVSATQPGQERQYGEILTLPEAAAYLQVEESALAEMAERSAIPARRITGEWRFSRRALEEWVRFPGLHPEDYWRIHPRWLFESPFMDEFLLLLEKRMLMHLEERRIEEPSPKPGSKQAVLQRFGAFRDESDLEEQLEAIRKWREAGG